MLKIGICEDDSNTREELHETISKTLFRYTDMEFAYYEDGDDIIQAVIKDELKLDLLILDIHMKNTDGMKTAEFIRKQGVDIDIIFMTVSEKHVFQGYKYKAFAYCLKPVGKSDLTKYLIQYIEEKRDAFEYLNVNINKRDTRIPFNKILYFESDKRKIIAHTVTQDYVFYSKMDDVEFSIKNDQFFRCHQSYMVNRDRIDSISRTEVMVSGISIPMSRKYYEQMNGKREVAKVKSAKSLVLNRQPSGALVFTKGRLLGTIIRIRDGKKIIVGRDAAQCDVVVNEGIVSRVHCKIVFHKNTGKYSICDYSKNGIYRKDGSKLPCREEVEMLSGEELLLGDDNNIIRLG